MPASMMQPDFSQEMQMSETRKQAMTSWQAQGWPGPRVESWRFTRLDSVVERPIAPVQMVENGAASAAPAIDSAVALRFVNGVLVKAAMPAMPAGVTISDLSADEAAMAEMR